MGPYFFIQLPDMVKWKCFRGRKGIEPRTGMHGGPEGTTKHSRYICIFSSQIRTCYCHGQIRELHYCGYPLLWSSAQSSWLQIQRSRVRLPALPDFLRSSGSGTESTQPQLRS
jgi:hypothetical protein